MPDHLQSNDPIKIVIDYITKWIRRKYVMIKRFKTLDQCSFQHRQNGYSLAEILLVFSIIFALLLGMWTTYIVLADEADALLAAAEIKLIRKAANDFKHEPVEEKPIYVYWHGSQQPAAAFAVKRAFTWQ